jgi:pantothenate kinase type III
VRNLARRRYAWWGARPIRGIQSGVVYGYAGQVDAILGRLREELGADS